jgi:hypothetical protein
MNQPITILMPKEIENDFTRKVQKFKTNEEHILASRVINSTE